jgi:osmotically-inducible protein OsmY
MILNVGRITKILACLFVLVAFVGCSAANKRGSAGDYVDDTVITTKVKAAIFDEPTLKTLQISVKTFQGEVQLSGFVDSAQNVTKAGEIARGVEGVTKVSNDLIVR